MCHIRYDIIIILIVGTLIQGSHASWEVLEFFGKISRTWTVLENDYGPGISLKFTIKVL